MRLNGILQILIALLVSGSGVAGAQPKAYEPLAVTYDTSAAADPALKSLIERLHLAIAERKLAPIDAALSPVITVIECDNDPTKPCSPAVKGAVRSAFQMAPPDRIRAALCCRDIAPGKITRALREETVLGLFGAALEEETIGTHPALPGAACLPAWPMFDGAKAAAIAAAADIENDNLRVTARELVLKARPAAGAPEIARLPAGQIAPLVTDLPESLPDGWTAIAIPQGGYGYTEQLGLNEIAPGGLCFMKNDRGIWEIALSIQRRS